MSRLLEHQKMSLSLSVDGFYHTNDGISENRYSFGLITYMGNESYFSGYPPGYLKNLQSARLSAEVRVNPFIVTLDNVRWYERMHWGAKVETGYIQYFLNGQKKHTQPLSLEMTFRYALYLHPDRPSEGYVKWAIPLRKIIPYHPFPPYRLYLGFSL